MSLLLALGLTAAAQGVSYAPPPMAGHAPAQHRRVILTHPGRFNRYPGYTVIRRGGFVPSYWAHPGFTIVQPRFYGFHQPFGGARWIRYYDDALLVDRYGRVHDGRYGHDWKRYRDHWSYDRRGIPIYVGNGNFYPEARDYAWAERMERGGDGELAYDRDYPFEFRYGAEGVAHGCSSGCGGGYTVTETTVTLPTTYREVTTYEDVVSYDRVRTHRPTRKLYRSKALRR